MKHSRQIHRNLAQFALAILATVVVLITTNDANGSDQNFEGNLTVTGFGSFDHGIDMGTNSETSINWSPTGVTMFDIGQSPGSFLWRDTVITTPQSSAANKMELTSTNVLRLYSGTTPGVVLDPASGKITLAIAGTDPGIYAGNTALLKPGPSGNPTFPANATFQSGLQLTAGQLSIATNTPATSSLTGSLTVAGGIGVSKDSYFNGVRIGLGAGTNNATNTAIGNSVLFSNSIGTRNSAIGYLTLANNVDGCDNTAIGYNSLNCNTCGSYNTATGSGSLALQSNGYFNAATGYFALHSNVSGSYNTAMGTYSLEFATGSYNTAVGYYSLGNNTTGVNNAALGYNALAYNGTGSGNVALGNGAGQFQGATGSSSLIQTQHSIYIGANSRALSNGDANSIVIGYGAVGQGANTTVIGNSDTVWTYINGSISASDGFASGSGSTALSNGMAYNTGSIGMAAGEAYGLWSAALSNSTSLGYSSTGMSAGVAYGHYSTAAGMGAEADSLCCVALGGATDNSLTSSPDTWVEIDPLFLIGNGADQGLGSNAVTVLKNGQTTLTNKAWKNRALDVPATGDPSSADTDSDGNALVVEGHTVLMGKVIINEPQGDISMGIYGTQN